MSIFEAVMLACFGSAWPFSIYRSYHARQNAGKSVIFLWIVLVGYAAGILHKLRYDLDGVIYLYILNSVFVLTDMILYYRNARLERHTARAASMLT